MKTILRMASDLERTVLLGPGYAGCMLLINSVTALLLGFRFLSRGYHRTFFSSK